MALVINSTGINGTGMNAGTEINVIGINGTGMNDIEINDTAINGLGKIILEIMLCYVRLS